MKPLVPLLSFFCFLSSVAIGAETAQVFDREELFATTSKINSLGWTYLGTKSRAHPNGNLVVSLFNVADALQPLQNGAEGETRKQLVQAIGDTRDYEKIHDFNRRFRSGIKVARLLVADKQLDVNEEFRRGIPNGQFHQLDIQRDPESARQEINRVFNEQTNGQIVEFLQPGVIHSQTGLITLASCAFDMLWANPFEAYSAGCRFPFHSSAGDIEVRGMRKLGAPLEKSRLPADVGLLGPEGSDMLIKPYQNRNNEKATLLSFVVIMPNEKQSLQDFLKNTLWTDIATRLKYPEQYSSYYDFELWMPRFVLHCQLNDFVPFLQSCGIKDVFNPVKADLSHLSPRRILPLEHVYHECLIDVNEQGTQAYAGSGGWVSLGARDKTLMINRPFIWFIYDHELDLVMFCGTLVNPEQAYPELKLLNDICDFIQDASSSYSSGFGSVQPQDNSWLDQYAPRKTKSTSGSDVKK